MSDTAKLTEEQEAIKAEITNRLEDLVKIGWPVGLVVNSLWNYLNEPYIATRLPGTQPLVDITRAAQEVAKANGHDPLWVARCHLLTALDAMPSALGEYIESMEID